MNRYGIYSTTPQETDIMAKTPPAPGSGVTTNKRIDVFFNFDKETPGTVRYQEDGDKDKHKVGTLYIKKSAGISGPRIKVTIEAS